MNAKFAKIALSSVAALMMVVGCAASDPSADDSVPTVETGKVGMNLRTGAKISSSSGAIGANSGTIVDVNPGDNNPPSPPLGCGGSCFMNAAGTGCACPAGYGYESSIKCPLSAP